MKTDFLRSRQKLFGLTLTAVAIIVVITGLISRRSQAEQLKQSTGERNIPTVSLLSASNISAAQLELPARIEPWARAPIYARVSGYLKNWTVDIGSKVKAGQLLAQIETPDLDQQLLQAKAELATAQSNLALSSSTAQRWQALLSSDAVSKQEVDEKTGDLTARQSVVKALQANVDRVQSLQAYTRLVAPFDGVVTARNTDIGALINVGGAPGSELFVISDVRRLRVYVSVPQRQLAVIRSGSVAQVSVPERPGRSYAAKVESLAQAISPGSGTMLIQLSVNNESGELLPGGFATVSFAAASSVENVSVPPGALMIGKNGVQVATVNSDNRVVLKQVTVARDMGNVIELAAGIDRKDRIVESPPDGLANGDLVRIAASSQNHQNTQKGTP
ncbi:efflux RND transporter periplasmic adaptor subunit [Undibacterium sp. CY18W]|uniref:Efflux RND transporter periplasmic adaptor subunit n=1 Tax=Undibacterium hunanense TaxID=2762292 RepID=A0ABR6ZVU1_9BURK|nr:efflux RND transporter periplasmic adaptor subunit [Undibacterium hunanense]MBC3919997.1 efflux RND transporter periplasmic adaptor subunit [Undibacterium hunanense]